NSQNLKCIALWNCTCLDSGFLRINISKKTLEAHRYLGVVFSPLMYRYVLAGAQACLREIFTSGSRSSKVSTLNHNL
ncbi:MAG: hypothetical protein NC100_12010, partial [Clostridium sp.]|nr:hypothetical protein [Clostridium sp.]